MAIHSGILAWEVSWTEEPGGLQWWSRRESDTTEHACTHAQGTIRTTKTEQEHCFKGQDTLGQGMPLTDHQVAP